MKSVFRRYIAVLGVFALVASLTTVLLGSTVASAAPQTYQCINSFAPTGPTIPVTMDVTGNAAPNPTVIPGQTTVSGMTLTGLFPGSQVQLGLNGGAIAAGDPLPISATMTVAGTNVAEAAQATTTQTDPTPTVVVVGGVAQDIPFSITFPDNLAFTPTSAGTSNFTVTQIDLSTVIGVIPFSMPDCVTSPPHSVGSVTVNAPATAPVTTDFSVSVPANQSVTIDFSAHTTDINNNIDWSTLNISALSSANGSLSAGAQPWERVYTNTGATPTPVTFTYSVSDTTPLASNTSTVTLNILGNLCDATAGPCSLNQILEVPVQGATMTMEQTGSEVTLGGVAGPSGCGAGPLVLNGQPQTACGAMNQITVLNARGTDAGWSLTGQVTDFLDATNTACPSNHCIPATNLGWFPSAAVAHTVILGDVAAVTAGAPLGGPLSSMLLGGAPSPGVASGMQNAGNSLCTAAATHSGGTFTCNAGLFLDVPASAAAGTYHGTLTLTLV